MIELKKKTNNEGMARSKADTYSSNKDNNSNISSLLLQSLSSTATYSNNKLENVLILQGGGSLGAFGCGVFSTDK